MKALLVIMTGIGFTLGVVLGLLLHLPSDSLPADQLSSFSSSRHRRSASDNANLNLNAAGAAAAASSAAAELVVGIDDDTSNFPSHHHQPPPPPAVAPPPPSSSSSVFNSGGGGSGSSSSHLRHDVIQVGSLSPASEKREGESRKSGANPAMNATGLAEKANTETTKVDGLASGVQRRLQVGKHGRSEESQQQQRQRQEGRLSEEAKRRNHRGSEKPVVFDGELGPRRADEISESKGSDDEKASLDGGGASSRFSHTRVLNSGGSHKLEDGPAHRTKSPEDGRYLSSLVRGVLWTDKLEQSCPRAFTSAETESWRKRADSLDVVKMEEGCGRMQNRLLTFRDASKACARYRLNTDQIQGEIFSYYLAKLLNVSNLPPTSLALVDSVDQKWRTVHLDLSLAQWADSKLVVLTQYLEGLEAAHIPRDFREDHRKLDPVLAHLGGKSRAELCELVQWSDLIVFDYLTANLDRVINNMFNRQWNDQIMESPAHNLEKFRNGKLVFLDNESGLFHGFRLIDKYESLHRALLDSLCVFRSGTASAIKRLAASGSVGSELRALFQQHEPLYRHVANLPQKNVKILQRRIEQVNEQISKCEQLFNR